MSPIIEYRFNVLGSYLKKDIVCLMSIMPNELCQL